ncbi:MFS transporter [Paenibacillus sp. Marseille-Q4541]|uniref:MFS transporter n=1 Tax=Paenibacillus sp. Marseille-Q4541 TaxID=2831522 RepID=UPI001BA9080B|nr:MFS transporter [Paenibacillus sp. Marseille-Q4541]
MKINFLNRKLSSESSLLNNRRFMRMFTAYATASFGEWFDAIAIQIIMVYRWGASPVTLALVPVAMALPGLILGSFAGVAADRFPKLKLMMLADLLTGILTLVLLTASHPYAVIPILMCRAAVSSFIMPAHQAMTRSLVREEQLVQATSLNGLVNQFSKIAGPLLGGMTLAIFSPQVCIGIGACARFASASLLWSIRGAETKKNELLHTEDSFHEEKKFHVDQEAVDAAVGSTSVWSDWKDGWTYLFQQRMLICTLIYSVFGLFALLMIDYQFTMLLREIAPDRESMLGILVAAIGAGSVVVMILVNRVGRLSYVIGLGGGYLGIGLGIAGLGLLQTVDTALYIIMFAVLIGVGNGLYMVTNQTIMQKESRQDMVGRVFGISNTVVSVVLISAPLLGGIVIESVGVRTTFFWIGCTIAVIGVVGFVSGSYLWGEKSKREKEATIKRTESA